MRWIVSSGKDIAGDNNQMQARTNYIRSVTSADVSRWNLIEVGGRGYFCCTSNDGIHGTFITAHIGDVHNLCAIHEVCLSDFVVANTCIWDKMIFHKDLLLRMMKINNNIELYFAKQELSVYDHNILRQTTTLNDNGMFGFQTSLSERALFKNRGIGLIESIRKSFIKVSPIILLGDLGVA